MNLVFLSGGEREKALVEGGATIVDFLANPFTPCVVYTTESKTTAFAANTGRAGEDPFVSYLWEDHASMLLNGYAIEYLAGEKVIFKMPKSYLSVGEARLEMLQSQNGFCELAMPDAIIGKIVPEFVQAGFELSDMDIPRWLNLQRKRDAEIEKMSREIHLFYEI